MSSRVLSFRFLSEDQISYSIFFYKWGQHENYLTSLPFTNQLVNLLYSAANENHPSNLSVFSESLFCFRTILGMWFIKKSKRMEVRQNNAQRWWLDSIHKAVHKRGSQCLNHWIWIFGSEALMDLNLLQCSWLFSELY